MVGGSPNKASISALFWRRKARYGEHGKRAFAFRRDDHGPLGKNTYLEEMTMLRRQMLLSAAALAAGAVFAGPAAAQDTVKIGLIVPMTGQQASTGKQIDAAVKLYQAKHGTTVAGKRVEVIVKDDGAVPDNTKRIAQELI